MKLLKNTLLCTRKSKKQKETKMIAIRSDHGKEFDNKDFKSFYNENGAMERKKIEYYRKPC